MNYIWGTMIIIGILYGTLTGQVEPVSDAVLSSAREAVSLCVTMLGVMALWTGLMEIAKDAGLVRSISKQIRPLLRFLFPHIPKEHPANEHISMNCVANVLGLGWAATPAGLRTMEALAELEEERRAEEREGTGSVEKRVSEKMEAGRREQKTSERMRRSKAGQKTSRSSRTKPVPLGTASNEMCTFLILNISSLQLIPVNVIAYRSQYGSVNPTAIVGPAIVATAVSTGVAVVFCKIMNCRKRRV